MGPTPPTNPPPPHPSGPPIVLQHGWVSISEQVAPPPPELN